MTDELIYLASPYSHPDPAVREQRFHLACLAAGAIMRRGVAVFSPIAHTHPIAVRCDLPKGWEFWQCYDRLHLNACSAVWVLMLDGWRESVGVQAEIAMAEEQGKDVIYLTPDCYCGNESASATTTSPIAAQV